MFPYKKSTKRIRLLISLVSAPLCLVISLKSGANDRQDTTNRFYFGRFSFAADTTGENIWSSYKIAENDIKLISKNGKRDIDKAINDAVEKINKLHKSGYPAYDQTIALEHGGAIVISKGKKYNFDIYYLTSKNTLYRQTVEGVSLQGFDNSIKITKDINSGIHFRNPTTPPPAGAFALEAGYIDRPLNKYPEQISIGLPISTTPGIHIIFDTQIIGETEPGLSSRYEERTTGGMTQLLKSLLSKTTLIRKRQLMVVGLPFEELLLKTKSDGRIFYSFRLEFPGTPEKSLEPYTVLELSTLDKGETFASDDEALTFWDKMVTSIERI
ncbi:T6SS immunity protein Tli4 family protein [Pseudomonas sp. SMSB3]|uniref:T6SS immunity protein Tli4 family protein n=1 Tax=Pseudomonas sp. SMSB3 TaxID=3390196 RepID=UPI003F8791FC